MATECMLGGNLGLLLYRDVSVMPIWSVHNYLLKMLRNNFNCKTIRKVKRKASLCSSQKGKQTNKKHGDILATRDMLCTYSKTEISL